MTQPNSSYVAAMAAALVDQHRADPAHAGRIAAAVCSHLSFDDKGSAVVVDRFGDATPESVDDIVERYRSSHPHAFAPADAAEVKPVSAPSVPPVPRGFRAPRTAQQKIDDRIAAALSGGNPYAQPTRNLTAAILLEALAPDKAAELRASASL